MLFQKKPGIQWLVVGLGNPGQQYEGTRHNVGWLALDKLARLTGTEVKRLKYQAMTGVCTLEGQSALLMKPMTFMNLSGQAVGQAARFYKLPPERVLVLSDDVSLPPGKLRVRQKGSAGGHNGLKSIIQHLGSENFPRIKIGVGEKPSKEYDMVAWVLGKFPPEERPVMEDAAERAAQAALLYLRQGPERAMAEFNGQAR